MMRVNQRSGSSDGMSVLHLATRIAIMPATSRPGENSKIALGKTDRLTQSKQGGAKLVLVLGRTQMLQGYAPFAI